MKPPKPSRKWPGSDRLPRNTVQVQDAFEACLGRAEMEDLKMMKQDIKNGTLLVVDDPSLTADGTRQIKGTNLSEIDKCHLEFLCAFVARVEKRFSPEQRRDLDQFEIGRLEGACNVLLWVSAPEKYPLFPFGRFEDEEPGIYACIVE